MVKKHGFAGFPFFKNFRPAFSAFSATCIGASHLKEGKPCQDYSACWVSANNDQSGFAIAAVADGHGGEPHFRSDRGAVFAVETAIERIKEFVMFNNSSLCEADQYLIMLEKSIIVSWHEKIANDARSDPLDGDLHSPYGTTLIATALTKHYWFAIQIGDGKCVVFNNDKSISQPVTWDERCFLNRTTSLCDEKASGMFRHFYSEETPLAIFLGSDGIDDTFPMNENEKHLGSFYQSIFDNFVEEGLKKGEKQMKQMLPLFTKKGSGDDVSIAGIIRGIKW